MLHRHLTHQTFSPAAIDDVISRGKWQDWAGLRLAVLQDASTLRNVIKICEHYCQDPYAQRYHFWMNYAKEHLTP